MNNNQLNQPFIQNQQQGFQGQQPNMNQQFQQNQPPQQLLGNPNQQQFNQNQQQFNNQPMNQQQFNNQPQQFNNQPQQFNNQPQQFNNQPQQFNNQPMNQQQQFNNQPNNQPMNQPNNLPIPNQPGQVSSGLKQYKEPIAMQQQTFAPQFVDYNYDQPPTWFEFEEKEPEYQGATDNQGQPHGQGKMIFNDGSTYDGNFFHGQKDGKGTFKQKDGITYQGQWKNGWKHGQGRLTNKDGSVIESVWESDTLSGQGTITDKKGNVTEAVWKKGIMIPLTNQGKVGYDRAFLNIIFVLISIGFFAAAIMAYIIQKNEENASWLAMMGIIFWIIQFGESCCSSTRKYISTIEPLSHIGTKIQEVRMSRPDIYFTIQNYHYETRSRWVTRRDKDGKEHRHREYYQERVNTHYARRHFYYNQWTDTSANPASIGYVSEFALTRLKMYKTFDFTPQTSYSYWYQLDQFKYHNICDLHYTFHAHKEIPGMNEHTLIHNDNKGPLPWHCNSGIFCLLSILGLSWIQRIAFVKNSTKVRYTINKLILN